jgi:GNAT superfamily N-acetyltransferase
MSWSKVWLCTQLGVIRNARPDDLQHLRDLERAAGEPFRDIGMSAVADDEPPTLDALASFQRDGRAWVVTDAADKPVAYLLLEVVDGNAHIEQVSVDPSHARRGLGKALLDTASVWADQHGLLALTLMTYVEVPWNAPYYRRLGFEVLADDRMTSGLRCIREQEAARGLARWPRVTMWRLTGFPGDSS